MKHFDDLTKIDCPLGELDDDTFSRFTCAWRAGAKIDILALLSASGREWIGVSSVGLALHVTYRLRPESLVARPKKEGAGE